MMVTVLVRRRGNDGAQTSLCFTKCFKKGSELYVWYHYFYYTTATAAAANDDHDDDNNEDDDNNDNEIDSASASWLVALNNLNRQ